MHQEGKERIAREPIFNKNQYQDNSQSYAGKGESCNSFFTLGGEGLKEASERGIEVDTKTNITR